MEGGGGPVDFREATTLVGNVFESVEVPQMEGQPFDRNPSSVVKTNGVNCVHIWVEFVEIDGRGCRINKPYFQCSGGFKHGFAEE